MSKVRVTSDANGNVVTISDKNPEYAHIRVVQEVKMYDDSGWLKLKQLSALIHADTETMLSMNYQPDQELPGNIIVRESHKPFSFSNPDRDLKYAGKTGIPCHVDGEPIYRKTFYSENPNAEHRLIAHTNTEEIREALRNNQVRPIERKIVQPGERTEFNVVTKF